MGRVADDEEDVTDCVADGVAFCPVVSVPPDSAEFSPDFDVCCLVDGFDAEPECAEGVDDCEFRVDERVASCKGRSCVVCNRVVFVGVVLWALFAGAPRVARGRVPKLDHPGVEEVKQGGVVRDEAEV